MWRRKVTGKTWGGITRMTLCFFQVSKVTCFLLTKCTRDRKWACYLQVKLFTFCLFTFHPLLPVPFLPCEFVCRWPRVVEMNPFPVASSHSSNVTFNFDLFPVSNHTLNVDWCKVYWLCSGWVILTAFSEALFTCTQDFLLRMSYWLEICILICASVCLFASVFVLCWIFFHRWIGFILFQRISFCPLCSHESEDDCHFTCSKMPKLQLTSSSIEMWVWFSIESPLNLELMSISPQNRSNSSTSDPMTSCPAMPSWHLDSCGQLYFITRLVLRVLNCFFGGKIIFSLSLSSWTDFTLKSKADGHILVADGCPCHL